MWYVLRVGLKLAYADMTLYVLRCIFTSTYGQLISNSVIGEYDMQTEPEFCPGYYMHILENNMNMLPIIFNVNTILVLSIYKIYF